jgi:hypothetical protein
MKQERDTSGLMMERDRLIAQLQQMLTELGWKPPSGDAIDEIAHGGVLTVPQAAIICETTDQTIYRWIEDAASKGRPLGKKVVTWLLGRVRLLDYVEKYQGGLPVRVRAENLLKKHWPIWSGAVPGYEGVSQAESSRLSGVNRTFLAPSVDRRFCTKRASIR